MKLFWLKLDFLPFQTENRRSLPNVFCKNGVLEGLKKFTEHTFAKVAGLRPLLKKDSCTGFFL